MASPDVWRGDRNRPCQHRALGAVTRFPDQYGRPASPSAARPPLPWARSEPPATGHRPEAASERLQRLWLGRTGFAPRDGGMDREGRVQVNGETATIGSKVGPRDIVKVSGRRVYLRFDEKRTASSSTTSRKARSSPATTPRPRHRVRRAAQTTRRQVDFHRPAGLHTDGLMVFTTMASWPTS